MMTKAMTDNTNLYFGLLSFLKIARSLLLKNSAHNSA